MRTLVLTNCTKAKKVDWAVVRKALEEAGLPTPGFDVEREDEYRRALARFVKPAVEMYGGFFEPVKKAVESPPPRFLSFWRIVLKMSYALPDDIYNL